MLIPKKSLSQNFLLDKNISKKIVKLIPLNYKNIIEIGPGTGSITNEIIKLKPNNLILIEKDYELYKKLEIKYRDKKNIKIYCEDVLKYDFSHSKRNIIISNLPYNISSKLIIKLLINKNDIFKFIFMVQKEFSDKISNQSKKNNKWKFFINSIANYKTEFKVPNTVFYPKPKINSIIITLFPKNNFKIDKKKLYKFSNEIFTSKRKKLNYFLKKNVILGKFSEIKDQRPEDLSNKVLMKLFNHI